MLFALKDRILVGPPSWKRSGKGTGFPKLQSKPDLAPKDMVYKPRSQSHHRGTRIDSRTVPGNSGLEA